MSENDLDGHIRAINTVSHKVSQYLNSELKDLGLSASTYFFILKIGDKGKITQDDLFKQIFLNPSNVTRRLNRLIKLGYVSKEKSANDKRVRVVKLTPLGQEKYQQLVIRLPTINQEVVQALTSDEVLILRRLVGKMETGLDDLLS